MYPLNLYKCIYVEDSLVGGKDATYGSLEPRRIQLTRAAYLIDMAQRSQRPAFPHCAGGKGMRMSYILIAELGIILAIEMNQSMGLLSMGRLTTSDDRVVCLLLLLLLLLVWYFGPVGVDCSCAA